VQRDKGKNGTRLDGVELPDQEKGVGGDQIKAKTTRGSNGISRNQIKKASARAKNGKKRKSKTGAQRAGRGKNEKKIRKTEKDTKQNGAGAERNQHGKKLARRDKWQKRKSSPDTLCFVWVWEQPTYGGAKHGGWGVSRKEKEKKTFLHRARIHNRWTRHQGKKKG